MMKKLFTLFIFSVLAICSLVSCSGEAFDIDSVNKQTLLVMFPWSGSGSNAGLYGNITRNLADIESAIVQNKGLKSTRVFVFISRSATESELFELTYNSSTFSVDHTPVDTYSDLSYTTTEGLTKLIGEVKDKAEALNYALIIGGHGSGWTNKDDWPSGQVKVRKGAPKSRFFGSANSTYGIDVPTLATAIEANGIKMQYILFDACYMANVETAYELRNATNFLVASPNEILTQGVPYSKVWSYLNNSAPSYASIVSTYCSSYAESETPYASLAAIDCRQMDNLAAIMKEINSKCTMTAERLNGVQREDGFIPSLFYDLGNYVDSLKPSGVLKDRFNTQLKATVKASKSTEFVFAESLDGEIKVNDFSGLSISDPSTHPVALRGKEKTSWWKATHE